MADYVVVDKEQLETDLTTVSDSIRGLLETEEKLSFPQGMKEAIESYSLDEPLTTQDSLIEQIKTALQGKSGSGEGFAKYITGMSSMFRETTFPEEYTLYLNIPNLKTPGNAEYFLYSTNVKKVVLEGNSNNISCSYAMAFYNCISLVEVDITNYNLKPTNVLNMFRNCSLLKTILGVIDLSNATNDVHMFYGCYELEEVRFKPEGILSSMFFGHPTNLSAESIQSIIDGLADLTGLETQTITLHADVKAKLTDEQITVITGKNWTLA